MQLGNERGRTRLHARIVESVSLGVLVSEGIWPPSAFLDGWGINVLVGDDSVAPYGGAAFQMSAYGHAEYELRPMAHFLCPDRQDIRKPDC